MNRKDRRHRQKRSQKPYFKTKNRTKQTTNFKAKSSRTGIEVTLGNVAGWEAIIENLEKQKNDEQNFLLRSVPFYNWLSSQKISQERLSIPFLTGGFRFANPKYGPLTITGSVGDGGRFNIGSAQMHPAFITLAKFGCLYLASSKECAELEAAKPIGCHQLFEVKPNKELKLWDLNGVIEDLKYGNLMEMVRESFGDRMWCFQKVPVVSQILSHRLKLEGGDGLFFESTKVPGHHNVALFFDTDDLVKSALSAEAIRYS